MSVSPDTVRIVEVGPRDGLQNEARVVPTSIKVELIERLADAGLKHIEAAAFVSPAWVPQMADSAEVMQQIKRVPGVIYSALVPNLRGFEAALASGVDEVAVFAAASESFSQKNINCSIDESFERFQPVLHAARAAGVRVRGYVSCVLGCPYEGAISPVAVSKVAQQLFESGCHEISLGDTIGVGTPKKAAALFLAVSKYVPLAKLAGHFHDTYAQALANVDACLELGVRAFDTSVSGLGGCPYAPGASGNLATEDLLDNLRGMGFETGIDMNKLLAAGAWVRKQLGSETQSRVARASARSHEQSR